MLMSADGNTFKGAAAQILLFPDLPLDSFLSLVSNIFLRVEELPSLITTPTMQNSFLPSSFLIKKILSSLDASVNWGFFFFIGQKSFQMIAMLMDKFI